MTEQIGDKQANILLALAKYKFLTYDQLTCLGIEDHKSNLSTLMSGLIKKRKSYVQKIPHYPGIAAKFYLTTRGMKFLVDQYDIEESEIHYSKRKISTDTQDKKHRTGIIDLHIALEQDSTSQQVEILFCDRYFDKVGNNRMNRNLKSKTALPFSEKSLKADMVFMLQTSYQKELYIVELENGKDAKKSITKCHEHAKLLFQGGVHDKYHFKQGYRTLWVFEHSSMMGSTIKALQKNPFFQHITEYFLFSTHASSSSRFFTDWINIVGKKSNLFYC